MSAQPLSQFPPQLPPSPDRHPPPSPPPLAPLPPAAKDYDIRGATPMTIACSFEQLHTAGWLLKQGVDLNAGSKTGETALFSAAFCGKLKAAKWLCDHGADLGAKDAQGRPQGVVCIKVARELFRKQSSPPPTSCAHVPSPGRPLPLLSSYASNSLWPFPGASFGHRSCETVTW